MSFQLVAEVTPPTLEVRPGFVSSGENRVIMTAETARWVGRALPRFARYAERYAEATLLNEDVEL